MKTQEEIEQMANEYAKQFDYAEDSSPFIDYIKGYTQCQEDMADKKYTEDDIKEAAYFFVAYKTAKNQDIFDKDIYAFIDYLNKQD